MKKIVLYITFIYMLTGMAACVDLDTTPYAEATGGNMWTTESLVEMGVTGVYSSLKQPIYSYSSALVGSSLRIGYYGLDVLGMSGSSRLGMSGLFTSSVTPGNAYFSDMWKWCFDGIHRANAAIAKIPGADMNEQKKATRLAEMKALRAFFYGRANEIFGNGGLGVPLYLEPIAGDKATHSQTSEAEIWDQVIKDLTEALPDLLDNDIRGAGRINKGAAYTLRGRAYLITKQYELAVSDFSKVSDCGYGLYTGAGDQSYKMLFKEANEQCEEMILSIQYIEEATKSYGSTLQKYVAAFQQGAKDSRGCWTDVRIAPAVVELYEVINSDGTVKPFVWTDFIPEWNNLAANDRKVFFIRNRQVNGTDIHSTVTSMINGSIGLGNLSDPVKALYLPEGNEERIKKAYANRDPRLAFNVVTPYAKFIGVNSNSTAEGPYIYRWPVPGKPFFDQAQSESNYVAGYTPSGSANAQNELVYMHRKFVGEGLEFAYRESNPIDEPIIRYADVLLMWAEALVEMNKLGEAEAKVKLVRDRAGIATPNAPFGNQATARNYVRDERRREFVGEGINFFDEMRWRTLKETKFDRKFVEQIYGGQVSTGGTYDWIGDQWYTWPVPKVEIERNKNLKPTPGWIYN